MKKLGKRFFSLLYEVPHILRRGGGGGGGGDGGVMEIGMACSDERMPKFVVAAATVT